MRRKNVPQTKIIKPPAAVAAVRSTAVIPSPKRVTHLGDNCIHIFIWGGISSDIRS